MLIVNDNSQILFDSIIIPFLEPLQTILSEYKKKDRSLGHTFQEQQVSIL